MSDTKQKDTFTVVGKEAPVRFSYLNVFKPRAVKDRKGQPKLDKNGQPKFEYSVLALIPKTNVNEIVACKKAIQAAMVAKFGDKVPLKYWNPLRDGDTDTKDDGSPFGPEAKGHMLVNCKSPNKPQVVGRSLGPDGKPLAVPDDGSFVSGDYGRISINFYGYDNESKGCGAGLGNVQFTTKGEPLAGGTTASDDFADCFEEADILA